MEVNDTPKSIGETKNEDMNDQNMFDIEEELKKLDGGSDVNVVKAVENDLSNDKQDKSDEEKSPTTSSNVGSPKCSKANESPPGEIPPSTVDPASIKSLANGSLPKSGKPMMLTLEKNTKKKVAKARGRPKQKAFVAMYQSQIKDNNLGIKLCIKKSDFSSSKNKKSSSGSSTAASTAKSKPARKRSRKSKQQQNSDSEASDYEKRRKRDGKTKSNNNTEKENEPKQSQSLFAERLPQHVLHRVSISPFHLK